MCFDAARMNLHAIAEAAHITCPSPSAVFSWDSHIILTSFSGGETEAR